MDNDAFGSTNGHDGADGAEELGRQIGGLAMGAAAIAAAVGGVGCEAGGLTTIVHVAEAYDFGRELGGVLAVGLNEAGHELTHAFDFDGGASDEPFFAFADPQPAIDDWGQEFA